MQVVYTVHNPHMTPAAVRATIKGQETTATVEALEVELVAEDSTHGGVKLRFFGSDLAAAQELFKNDAKITATFAAQDKPEQDKAEQQST